MNQFFGVLTVGIALALLAKEWAALRRHQADPDELLPYDENTFRRRALVSILLMLFVAVAANQTWLLETIRSPSAKLGYLSLYLLCVSAIYVLVVLDFRHGRRVALQMVHLLSRQQAEYVDALRRLSAAAREAEASTAPDAPLPKSEGDASPNEGSPSA